MLRSDADGPMRADADIDVCTRLLHSSDGERGGRVRWRWSWTHWRRHGALSPSRAREKSTRVNCGAARRTASNRLAVLQLMAASPGEGDVVFLCPTFRARAAVSAKRVLVD